MKPTEKNDVDLLLKSLAQRSSVPSGPAGEDHLDADELSAFAEDALPSATRARYMTHIADCTNCRRLVTQLALAAGVVTSAVASAEPAPISFWERLTALLSPNVLRYVAPLLILSLVVVLGLITVRQRRSDDLVALNTPAAEPGLTSATEQPVGPQTLEQQNSTATARQTQTTTQEESKQEGNRSDGTADTKSNLAKAESESAAAAPPPPRPAEAVTNEPTYAPEPRTSAQPAAAQSTAATTDRAEAQAKEKGEEKADAAKSRDDRDLRYDEEKDRVAAREVHSLPSVGRSGPRRSEEVSSARARKAQVIDVRTVSGREFRREGKRWIDSAYESQALTSVKRNSEQFRALTADEPQLQSIADALPGTVIVIWKGRAYRID